MAVILVVDDEQNQRNILRTILSAEGYETHVASSGEEALQMMSSCDPDIVLTDLKMEGMDGIELVEKLRSDGSGPVVILMTAYGTIPSVVEAMNKGAYSYLEKPVDREKVLLTVRNATERAHLIKENRELQKVLYEQFSIERIVGPSEIMQQLLTATKKIATSSATVLILGESGTGKELIARAIHWCSPRKGKRFTAINCAAIPESLLESELFGYEKGAFTNARESKPGLFEITRGGTIFLDEIGDMSLTTQSKILRVLQEKTLRRLAGKDEISVDVRIVAATNKDLEKEMTLGRFREDLYYRLRVVALEIPPLRERREDIPALVEHFKKKYTENFGKLNIKEVDGDAKKALEEYHWPGNVRQLESVIERAILMSESDTITLTDIENELRGKAAKTIETVQGLIDNYPAIAEEFERVIRADEQSKVKSANLDIPDEGLVFEDLEKEILKKAMSKANNVAAKAARLLGMSYKTFWYRWEKFGLEGSSPKKEDIP